MAKINQRLALQIVICLYAIVPIFIGLNAIYRGPSMLANASNYPIPLDSHFRYLSGLTVGMGILLLRSLPTINRDGSDLRRVALLIFIGGLGRLWGLIAVGLEVRAVVATFAELFVLPLICLWQNQVQQKSVRTRTK